VNTFLPGDYLSLLLLAIWVVIAAVTGYLFQRSPQLLLARPASWFLALGVPFVLAGVTAGEPPGYRMLVIITALFFGMKIVVGLESSRPLTLPRWLIFTFCWPGMRPYLFAEPRHPRPLISYSSRVDIYRAGLYHTFVGAGIIVMAIGIAAPVNVWFASALLLIGISLFMHFGLFNLNAAALRLAGFDCRPVFREPLKAKTLNEFWSRRWNTAYSEMIALTVFRPLASRIGPAGATIASFGCSGLFHEMAISLPVMRGFGLPMLYFLIQAVFILLEQKLHLRPVPAKILTILVILLPMPIMFHPWFIEGGVIPLLK